jgi:hypothetical protein
MTTIAEAVLCKDWQTTVFEAQSPMLRTTITIPAGTKLRLVDDPMGVAWAVDDVQLLIELTGNSHDPIYRYVYVPNSLVGSA